MTVTNTTAAASTTANTKAAAANETKTKALTNLTSDFETFLTLLTAQIRHQDPQDPVDSTQFVAQLASFAGVEQQIATNTKLDQLLGLNAASAEGLSHWLGTKVRGIAATEYEGVPIEVSFTVPKNSSSAKVTVMDGAGQIIERIAVEKGRDNVTWTGPQNGETGPFKFGLETYDGNKLTGTIPAETYSQVVEARQEQGKTLLLFRDGTQVEATQATHLRKRS